MLMNKDVDRTIQHSTPPPFETGTLNSSTSVRYGALFCEICLGTRDTKVHIGEAY